ncbi:hypothetical protein DID88_007730 [Monilinia fructigena]|uniref:Integrase catalytic domain-containing protein n=1 Tax=Monilinia fructigena TaxID=38457 RepID=A0A395J477_9HELO|nr:hypothetical protein DID88_007730 [Monilinia fructigena]
MQCCPRDTPHAVRAPTIHSPRPAADLLVVREQSQIERVLDALPPVKEFLEEAYRSPYVEDWFEEDEGYESVTSKDELDIETTLTPGMNHYRTRTCNGGPCTQAQMIGNLPNTHAVPVEKMAGQRRQRINPKRGHLPPLSVPIPEVQPPLLSPNMEDIRWLQASSFVSFCRQDNVRAMRITWDELDGTNLISSRTSDYKHDAEIRQKLPLWLQDKLPAFLPRHADTLPPRRAWDHKIELMPGKEPPYFKNRPLSPLELEVVPYLDDVLVYSADKSEHREHVRTIVQKLADAGLQIDINKCEFETVSTPLSRIDNYNKRADNGRGEFGSQFQLEISKKGLIFEPSPPGKHSMNGVAEKKIQDISATARSLLSESGIEPRMWELTTKHAVYLKNRSPTKSLPFGEAGMLSLAITPYEAMSGRQPDFKKLRIFGCKAWARNPQQPGLTTKKFESRILKGEHIFIGMDGNSIYLLLNLHSNTIYRTADADFDEYRYPLKDLKEKTIPEQPGTVKKRKSPPHDKNITIKRRVRKAQEDVQIHTNERQTAQTRNERQAQVYPSRMLRQRQLQANEPAQEVQVPQSSRQRVQVVVEIPRVRPVPTATLVRDALNDSCKKRLRKIFSDQVVQHVVALQAASVHPEASPISNLNSILEESVELDDAMQGDAQAWMEAIRNELQSLKDNGTFEIMSGAVPAGKKLLSSRYVLRNKLDRFGGLARRKARLVIKGYLQRYGIDFQETFAGVARYSTLRTLLAKAAAEDLEIDNMDVETAFLNGELTDTEILMEVPRYFEEIFPEIKLRDEPYLKLKKSLYGLKQAPRVWWTVVRRFFKEIELEESTADPNLFIGKGVYISYYLPLPPGTVIRNADKSDLLCEDDKTFYLQIVGSTIYLSNCTRPDIAYAVGQLARVMQAPGENHLILAKHLLQYLAGTFPIGVVYSNRLNMLSYEYRIYTDSTWGSSEDRKSVQGVALIRYGGAIVWSSTKQKSTSLCTMEAEIIAANEGAKDIAWMEKLVKDLGERSEDEPFIPTLYCDNESGVDWMQENKFHSKAKHIDIRWHYIRKDMVEAKRLRIVWIPGTDQTADTLTKQLTYPGFTIHGKGLGLDLEC